MLLALGVLRSAGAASIARGELARCFRSVSHSWYLSPSVDTARYDKVWTFASGAYSSFQSSTHASCRYTIDYTSRLMRNSLPSRLYHHRHGSVASLLSSSSVIARPSGLVPWRRTFAKVRDPDHLLNGVCFRSTSPIASANDTGPHGDHKPPDERTVKLGKSTYSRWLCPGLSTVIT